MILYNTTFHIEKDICSAGLEYLKKQYIPRAVAGGILTDPRLSRVLSREAGGDSYALQFRVKDADALNDWLVREGSALQNELIRQFGEKIAGFTTLLEEIDWES